MITMSHFTGHNPQEVSIEFSNLNDEGNADYRQWIEEYQ